MYQWTTFTFKKLIIDKSRTTEAFFQKNLLFFIRVNPVSVSSKHQYIISLENVYTSTDSLSVEGLKVDGYHLLPKGEVFAPSKIKYISNVLWM
jgi:hypothetical protein